MSSTAAVFQIGSLGDSIVSVPSLLSLRELLPDCSEYILVNRVQDSVRVLSVEVFDQTWKPKVYLPYLGTGNIIKRAISVSSVLARLRYFRPRYAVYLLPAERTSAQVDRDRAFFRAAGVRELVGFRELSPEETGHNACPAITCGQAYLRFRRLWNEKADEKFPEYAKPPLLTTTPAAHERVKRWLDANRRFPGRAIAAVAPFSNAEAKHWVPSSTVELLNRLEAGAGVEAVLIGARKDFQSAADVVSSAGAGLNACGQFSVEESAALFSLCRAAVCVDSGPMHLAAAVGLPTTAIFSRTNPNFCRWLPLGESSTVLYREVGCAGCNLLSCNVPGHPCMSEVSVDDVMSITAKKLAGVFVGEAVLPSGTRVLQPSMIRSHVCAVRGKLGEGSYPLKTKSHCVQL